MSRQISSRLDEVIPVLDSLWDYFEFGTLPQQPTPCDISLPVLLRLDAYADIDCAEPGPRPHCQDVQCLAHGGRADVRRPAPKAV